MEIAAMAGHPPSSSNLDEIMSLADTLV